jgi:hypothetical protein
MKEKPVAVTLFPWLRENLGKSCLAALTSTDRRALEAAVQIIALLGYDRNPGLVMAFGACVLEMQPSTREFAFHAIAHVLDWNDRGRIWSLAGLPECNPGRCQHEPKRYEQ